MATGEPISIISLSSSSTIEQLLRACDGGRSEEVESVLGEGRTQEDRTALANYKTKEMGFTPLHRVCHHGHHQCIPPLLKQKADPHIWDHCGFAPIHCAARGNHTACVEMLINSRGCDVAEKTEFGETPFLIACLSGAVDVAKCLYEAGGCGGVSGEASGGNSVLHYAAASDSAELLLWLLSIHDFKALIDSPNDSGHTPLHHACALGCTNSLSALLHHNAIVSSLTPSSTYLLPPSSPSLHPHPLSHSEMARQLGNSRCYEIVGNSATPPPLPHVSTTASFNTQGSQVSEDLLKQGQSAAFLPPQRSNSSGSRRSQQSLLTTTALQRRGSLVGANRPVTLELRRSLSLRRGSEESLLRRGGGGTEEERRTYLQSRSSATRLSQTLSRQSSSSVEQLLYDSTAYEPPPDILFVLPVDRKVLTSRTRKVYSSEHGLKLRVSNDYWSGDNKSHGLHVCLGAAMHYSQTFPQGYTVVSPICFLSCRSKGSCHVSVTLPHAVDTPTQDSEGILPRLVILSSATAKIDTDPQSPFFSPSERILAPLDDVNLSVDRGMAKFHTELSHPSLFAVAVRDTPGSIPLPLRCCLYVLYPLIEPSVSMVTGFDVEAYVGMNIPTVATAVMSWAEQHDFKLEETHFVMSGEQVTVSADLIPPQQTDWGIERRGDGKFHYNQVSLTQHTDRDSYSHQLVYPHRERFFIEPQSAASAVKCKISVSNSIRELSYLLVIPYSPKKEATPDLSSPEHRHSLPLSSHPPPPGRRHSLPPSSTSHTSFRIVSPIYSPSHFPQILLSHPATLSHAIPNPSPRPSSANAALSRSPPPPSASGTIAGRSPPPPSASGTISGRSPPPPSASGTISGRSPPPPSASSTIAGRSPPPPSASGTVAGRSPPPPSASGTVAGRSPPPPSASGHSPILPPVGHSPRPHSAAVPAHSSPYRPAVGTIPGRSPILYLPNGAHRHSESQV